MPLPGRPTVKPTRTTKERKVSVSAKKPTQLRQCVAKVARPKHCLSVHSVLLTQNRTSAADDEDDEEDEDESGDEDDEDDEEVSVFQLVSDISPELVLCSHRHQVTLHL